MMSHPTAQRIVEVIEFLIFAIGVGILLNVAAGPTPYWQAGILALACFACALPMFLYLGEHRDLFKWRIRFGPGAEPETSQKIIVLLLMLVYAALYVAAGLDHRFGWSHVPIFVVVVGDLLFAGGLVLIVVVFRANTYAAAAVTVEAGQKVIASGPYAQVRHPMYGGMLALFLGLPLVLGSWWALVTLLPPLLLVLQRILDEERYLSMCLLGYQDYCAHVPHRLIPTLW